MSDERDNIRHAADMLAGYAATCQMKNTLEWMEGLAKRLNDYLEAIDDSERVETWGNGLTSISKDKQQ
jgi:hypothetical protein